MVGFHDCPIQSSPVDIAIFRVENSLNSRSDTVTPSTVASTISVSLGDPTRTRRPVKMTRPPALYLPNGLPLSFDPSIVESIWFPETPDSSCTESPPGSATSTWDHDSSIRVKAAFNATIIMLRASRTTSFVELKKRLYDKFVKQEGLRLSRRLTVVSVRPPPNKRELRTSSSISTLSSPSWIAGALCRLGRVQNRHSATFRKESSSLEQRRLSFAELTQMHFIEDEVDWQKILARHFADGTKVTLRILDTPI